MPISVDDRLLGSQSSHPNEVDRSDSESDRLWNAWKARGIEQGRELDRRFKRLEIALCAIGLAAVLFVTFFG